MTDDERRAEIEALLSECKRWAPMWMRIRIDEALDRLRDARGDDEAQPSERRECGHPLDDGSGRICRRICAPGRDYHGGGHWYAAPDIDGELVRESTARWIVTGSARSPQGEDHEDEVGRIVRFLVDAGCDAAAAMVEVEFGRPPVG